MYTLDNTEYMYTCIKGRVYTYKTLWYFRTYTLEEGWCLLNSHAKPRSEIRMWPCSSSSILEGCGKYMCTVWLKFIVLSISVKMCIYERRTEQHKTDWHTYLWMYCICISRVTTGQWHWNCCYKCVPSGCTSLNHNGAQALPLGLCRQFSDGGYVPGQELTQLHRIWPVWKYLYHTVII